MNPTLNYYKQNAQSFFDNTFDKPMQDLYEHFLPHLPKAGHILDAGCGSGRDTKAFLELGFHVSAFDASKEMVALATSFVGRPVIHSDFKHFKSDDTFDGIWAAASLLHLPYQELVTTINTLSQQLKKGGYFYASFKYGETSYTKEGRHFTPLNPALTRTLFSEISVLTLEEVWLSDDVRQERKGEKWLNLLAKKGETNA